MAEPFVLQSDGRIAVRLPSDGIALLAQLVGELEVVIGNPDADPATRLFPRAYADAVDELGFEERHRGELVDARRQRLETMRRILASGRSRRGVWKGALEPDELHAWIGFCNDARLVLGSLLEITEDEQPREYLSPKDPGAPSVNAYLWLGALLETALGVISPDEEDDHAE